MARIPRALLPHRGVTVEPYEGKTGRGEKWGQAVPLSGTPDRPGRVLTVQKRRQVKNAAGDVVMSTAQVYMPGTPSTPLPPFESKVSIFPGTAWARTARVMAYDLYDAGPGSIPGCIVLFLE